MSESREIWQRTFPKWELRQNAAQKKEQRKRKINETAKNSKVILKAHKIDPSHEGQEATNMIFKNNING